MSKSTSKTKSSTNALLNEHKDLAKQAPYLQIKIDEIICGSDKRKLFNELFSECYLVVQILDVVGQDPDSKNDRFHAKRCFVMNFKGSVVQVKEYSENYEGLKFSDNVKTRVIDQKRKAQIFIIHHEDFDNNIHPDHCNNLDETKLDSPNKTYNTLVEVSTNSSKSKRSKPKQKEDKYKYNTLINHSLFGMEKDIYDWSCNFIHIDPNEIEKNNYCMKIYDLEFYKKSLAIEKRKKEADELGNLQIKISFEIFGKPKEFEWIEETYWKLEREEEQGHDVVGIRGVQPEKRAKNIIAEARLKKERNLEDYLHHRFQNIYFAVPAWCALCKSYMWGLSSDYSIQCVECGICIHEKCLNVLSGTCSEYKTDEKDIEQKKARTVLTVARKQKKMDEPLKFSQHDLSEHRNYLNPFKRDSRTSKFITLFSTFYYCRICGSNFAADTGVGICTHGLTEKHIQDTWSKLKEKNNEPLKLETNYKQLGEDGTVILSPEDQAEMYASYAGTSKKSSSPSRNQRKKIGDLTSIVPAGQRKHPRQGELYALLGSEKHQFDLTQDFAVENVIGEGGFGTVFLSRFKQSKYFKNNAGHYENDKNLLAIKRIRKDKTLYHKAVDETQREKEILFYNNPFIAKGIITFQDNKFLYFVMEFVGGGNLYTYLLSKPEHDNVSEQDIKWISSETFSALRYLHRRNIIYRDIKLENIMIGMDGHVRMVDFGLVKQLADKNDTTSTICGTPDYMAPEIYSGAPYDCAVDMWSMGILMFELKFAFSPFSAKNDMGIACLSLKSRWVSPLQFEL